MYSAAAWSVAQRAMLEAALAKAHSYATKPGFITGDWSVEYPEIAARSGGEMQAMRPVGGNAEAGSSPARDIFPAAAMRDSAF